LLGVVQQAQRAAHIEFRFLWRPADQAVDVQPAPCAEHDLDLAGVRTLQLIGERHVGRIPAGIDQAELASPFVELARHADQGSDADSAGQQQVVRTARGEREGLHWLRHGDRVA
jgi:hypothetical protein